MQLVTVGAADCTCAIGCCERVVNALSLASALAHSETLNRTLWYQRTKTVPSFMGVRGCGGKAGVWEWKWCCYGGAHADPEAAGRKYAHCGIGQSQGATWLLGAGNIRHSPWTSVLVPPVVGFTHARGSSYLTPMSLGWSST